MVRAKLMNGRYKHTSDSPASIPQTDLTSQHRPQSNKTPLLARQGPRRAGVGAHEEEAQTPGLGARGGADDGACEAAQLSAVQGRS